MTSSNIFAGMVVNAVSLSLNQLMKTDTIQRERERNTESSYSTLTRKIVYASHCSQPQQPLAYENKPCESL